MIIENAEINWREGWANDPSLSITATKVPDNDSYIYKEKRLGGSTIYFALHKASGLASFFVHSPNNESGFGGHEFTLQMQDGDAKTIKGPWSSRCSVMNMYFPHTFEVTVNGCSSYLAVNKAADIVEQLGAELVKTTGKDGEIRYKIRKWQEGEGAPSPMSKFTNHMVDKYGTGA